ncbi:MAG: hypothetical protein H0T85_01100 [Geodermatophilaceae bacterium]|nr:hypothetical protein [Geodermatophilaceae bacterium]
MVTTKAPERAHLWRWLHGVLLVTGMFLCLWVFFIHLEVYLVFLGAQPEVTDAAVTRYEWVAGSAVLVASVGVVVALFRGRWKALVAHTVLLAVTAGVVAFFAVPTDRWEREPPPNDPGPGDTPCYSGSNDCVGG